MISGTVSIMSSAVYHFAILFFGSDQWTQISYQFVCKTKICLQMPDRFVRKDSGLNYIFTPVYALFHREFPYDQQLPKSSHFTEDS